MAAKTVERSPLTTFSLNALLSAVTASRNNTDDDKCSLS